MKFLFENFLSKAQSKTRDYIRENCSDAFKKHLDTKVSELPPNMQKDLKNAAETLYNSCVENGLTLINYLRLTLESRFDIRYGKGPVKYLPGIARIACTELKMFDNGANDSEISRFKNDIMFLHENPGLFKIQYDKDLNGLSYDNFHKQIAPVRKEFNEKKRSQQTKAKGNTNYKIIPINSFEEAHKYGGYTSWCVTQAKSHYDSYTTGGRRFYFCLEKGFEMVDDTPGEGCPLDEYGLSMISVLIDTDGEPNYITTRWNHKYDGENNENFHTVEQFEKITGIPFYQTFKPYTREELRKMGITSFDEAKERLENGEDPRDIFNPLISQGNGLVMVGLNHKKNFINIRKNKLISDIWFDDADDFHYGFACVINNDKYNFINTEGKFISDEWFDLLYNFHDGFAAVKNNGKWNFINTEGKIISDEWFDLANDFFDGFAVVKKNGKYNFINAEGKLISDEWFDFANDFHDGFACVGKNGKYNFINTEGKIISDIWFDDASDFHNGFARVLKNGKYNFINAEGKIISDIWFDGAVPFNKQGFTRIKINGKIKYLDKNGKIHNTANESLFSEDFDKSNKISNNNHDRMCRYTQLTNTLIENLQERIDTSSFQPKSELNQKLWDEDMNLNIYARRQLLAIARDFIHELDLDDFSIEDIIMTGSLANYNWDDEYSDIDLHILVDFGIIGNDREISKMMFDAIRKDWNNKHSGITIFGYPVEIYVQDTEEEHRSSGVYSLLNGEWINKPDPDYMDVDIDDELIEEIAGNYEDEVDDLADRLASAETDEDFEHIYGESVKLYDEIKSQRKKGMAEDKPEMSTGNLIFKALRRSGSIEKLIDIRNQSYDKLLSI